MRPLRSCPHRWLGICGVFLALALVLAACSPLPQPPGPEPTSTPTRVPTSTPEPTARPSPTRPVGPTPTLGPILSIPTAMGDLLANEPGIYGVVAETPSGRVLYSRNADVPFISASLYKLVLMAVVYDQRAAGQLSFDEQVELSPSFFDDPEDLDDGLFTMEDAGTSIPVSTALTDAIQWSNNIAARALLAQVGDQSVNEEAQRLGMTHTHFLVDLTQLRGWPPTDAGTPAVVEHAVGFIDQWTAANGGQAILTTPGDMAHFFQLLMAGQVVNPQASAEMLDLLKGQNIDTKFPVLLPSNTVIAHKTGDLDGVVHHDVGVIYAPSGPVIVAALSEDAPDDGHAEAVIQRLALIAYGTRHIPSFADGGPPASPGPGTPATARHAVPTPADQATAVPANDATAPADSAPTSPPNEQATSDTGG